MFELFSRAEDRSVRGSSCPECAHNVLLPPAESRAASQPLLLSIPLSVDSDIIRHPEG